MKKILTLLSSALLATGAWAQNFENGHEYVNLGLPSGTMWATCNIGADASEAAGYYYAWGETETKENYSWSTYKWCKGSDHTQTKYVPQSKASDYGYEGFYDDKFTLEKADDVASKLWGGSWVVPTHAQQDELWNECDWEWTSINGVNGYKVKSRVNSNFIFLPAAGSRWNTKFYDVGDNGNYWSSSLNESFPNNAQYLDISLSKVSSLNSASRGFGYSIRPVFVAPIAEITIGEETTKYYDVDEFREAFYAIGGTATVKLLGDITLPENGWFYNDISTADITLDLNGHNIIGNVVGSGVIEGEFNCTITGNGVVENNSQDGSAFGAYGGSLVVNEGTYISMLYVCYVTSEATIVINGGKFKAPNLYYDEGSYNKPIVKGGLFSMDPSDCVADGYEAVENDAEDTKGDYPYKVVEKSSTPTAIDAVDAEKSGKVVKTIENGKVVIIRNNKKYDLSGRELY